jgi:hypothetical protein
MMVVVNITNMEAGIARISQLLVYVAGNTEPYVITISMSYAKGVVIVRRMRMKPKKETPDTE